MALFYFIASIVIASIAPKEGIYGAAAVRLRRELNKKKKQYLDLSLVLWFCSIYYVYS